MQHTDLSAEAALAASREEKHLTTLLPRYERQRREREEADYRLFGVYPRYEVVLLEARDDEVEEHYVASPGELPFERRPGRSIYYALEEYDGRNEVLL